MSGQESSCTVMLSICPSRVSGELWGNALLLSFSRSATWVSLVNGQRSLWQANAACVGWVADCTWPQPGWTGGWGVSYYLFNCCTPLRLLPFLEQFGAGQIN